MIPKFASQKAFLSLSISLIISLMMSVGVVAYSKANNSPAKARDAARMNAVQKIKSEVELNYAEKGLLLPQKNRADVPCFTEALSKDFGFMRFYQDPKPQGSCGLAGKEDHYYYRVVDNRFYIIAAKVEIITNGNVSTTIDELNKITTREAADRLLGPKIVAGGNYYVVVGPL